MGAEIQVNSFGVITTYASYMDALDDLSPVDVEAGKARVLAFIAANAGSAAWTPTKIAEKFGLDRHLIKNHKNGLGEFAYGANGCTCYTATEAL